MLGCSAKYRKQPGFTLVELLIVVAIVGLLAAIALPSYQQSVIKGRRAAAQGLLMDLAQREQQYFADSRSFTSDLAVLGVSVPADVAKYYTVAVTLVAGPPASFLIEATPVSGTQQTVDGVISIDKAGERLPADKW
ncbi:MAG: type IV pilin protein [Oceanococcus sp.]